LENVLMLNRFQKTFLSNERETGDWPLFIFSTLSRFTTGANARTLLAFEQASA
jgi:hypothetical protein